MFGTSVLVFVVTLMSIINHSYLNVLVELPSINDKTFEEYIANVFAATNTARDKQYTEDQCQMILYGKLLTKQEFDATLSNYNKYKGMINESRLYQQIRIELSNFTDETSILTRIRLFRECGTLLKKTVEDYIKLREKKKEDYIKKQQEGTESSPSTKPEKTGEETSSSLGSSTEPEKDKIVAKFEEEINYLRTLLPMTSDTGRIQSLLLNTLYGNSHNQTNATDESLRSVWLFLIKKLDPMFGESYISYVIRMIQQDKMPLPQELIPHFYGKGKLRLFEKFDVWPELNAVFVMYYMFHCDFEVTKPTSTQDKPVEEIEPILKQSEVSLPSGSNES